MIEPSAAGGAGNSAPPRIKLDYATIVAIQKCLDKIETGHGSVTLDVSQFQLIRIRHEESTLLSKKRPGMSKSE